MRIDKLFQVEKASAKEPGRYAMNSVKFERDCAAMNGPALIATDGRVLAMVPVAADDADADGLIPREAFSEARRGAFKRSPDVEIVANGSVKFMGKLGPMELQRADAEFPRYGDLAAKALKQTPAIVVGLNPAFLLALAQAIGIDERNPAVSLAITSADKPIIVRVVRTGAQGVGIIMPHNVSV